MMSGPRVRPCGTRSHMAYDPMGDVSGEDSNFTPVPPTAYALAPGAHFEGGRRRPPESPDNVNCQ